jgi:hypothetical protein
MHEECLLLHGCLVVMVSRSDIIGRENEFKVREMSMCVKYLENMAKWALSYINYLLTYSMEQSPS